MATPQNVVKVIPKMAGWILTVFWAVLRLNLRTVKFSTDLTRRKWPNLDRVISGPFAAESDRVELISLAGEGFVRSE